MLRSEARPTLRRESKGSITTSDKKIKEKLLSNYPDNIYLSGYLLNSLSRDGDLAKSLDSYLIVNTDKTNSEGSDLA